MNRKVLLLGSALVLVTMAGAANAADVGPLPRDWSGLYAGLHVGVASGIDSSLDAYGSSFRGVPAEQTSIAPQANSNPGPGDIGCWKENQNGSIVIKGGGATEAQCKSPFEWSEIPDNKDNPVDTVVEQTDYSAHDSSNNDMNFLAGINVGYNYQSGAMVFGVEADISGLFNGKQHLAASAGYEEPEIMLEDVNGISSLRTSADGEFGLSNVGTLRARLGYDIDGTWLPFITGGLAWGKVSTKGTAYYDLENYNKGAVDIGPDATHSFGDSDWEMGWTLGAGINYRVADNAFIGLTYLYTDLGKHSFQDSYVDEVSGLEGSVKGEVDARFHTVRLSFDVMF